MLPSPIFCFLLPSCCPSISLLCLAKFVFDFNCSGSLAAIKVILAPRR